MDTFLYNKANSKGEASLHILDVIGEFGVTAKQVTDALTEAADAKVLTVYVSSPGGDFMAGKAIYNALSRYAETHKVVAIVDGLAASAASFILMAAHEILMQPEATMMIHEVRANTAGTSADLRATADLIDTENKNLVAIYARRTGRSPEDIASMLAAETYFTAAQAVEEKLATGIVGETTQKSKPRLTAANAKERVADLNRQARYAAANSESLRIRAHLERKQ